MAAVRRDRTRPFPTNRRCCVCGRMTSEPVFLFVRPARRRGVARALLCASMLGCGGRPAPPPRAAGAPPRPRPRGGGAWVRGAGLAGGASGGLAAPPPPPPPPHHAHAHR